MYVCGAVTSPVLLSRVQQSYIPRENPVEYFQTTHIYPGTVLLEVPCKREFISSLTWDSFLLVL